MTRVHLLYNIPQGGLKIFIGNRRAYNEDIEYCDFQLLYKYTQKSNVGFREPSEGPDLADAKSAGSLSLNENFIFGHVAIYR